MRTYSRETFLAARQAWADGDYGPKWNPLRIAAAERGFIYPPTGSKHDDRESNTQRAIIWHAFEDNPKAVTAIVWRCSSWNEVVDRIIGLEARLAADATERERISAWEKDQDPTHTESTQALGGIIRRIADSAGVDAA